MVTGIMKSPRSVEIEITSQCNLRCRYCSHFTSAGDVNQELTMEEWLTFFEELNRCAVLKVSLQGGEPFCRGDILGILDGIVRNRMRFSILSNGALLTNEIAAFLNSTGRCDFVQISIDGSNAFVHDSFRGTGSFLKAINGIKILQRHNLPTTVRVTIHKQNVRDLERIANLLLEEIGLPGFSVNSASYMGLCRQDAEVIQLDIEERTYAMEILLKLNRKYNGRINATSGPLADAKNWLKMKQACREKKERLPNCGSLTACGCIMHMMGVRADGIMVPCLLLGHIEMGRINMNNLQDIWQNHPEFKRLRGRHSIPLSDFKYCSNCDFQDYCTGNCPASAYYTLGNDQHPSPTSCLKEFLEGGGRLPDEKLLLTEN